jgi:hypothetical protein
MARARKRPAKPATDPFMVNSPDIPQIGDDGKAVCRTGEVDTSPLRNAFSPELFKGVGLQEAKIDKKLARKSTPTPRGLRPAYQEVKATCTGCRREFRVSPVEVGGVDGEAEYMCSRCVARNAKG